MNLSELLQSGGNLAITANLADLQAFGDYLITEAKKAYKQELTEVVNNDFLAPQQAAKALNVSRSTLWRWHKIGYLPAAQIGGKFYYKIGDIKSLKESGKK